MAGDSPGYIRWLHGQTVLPRCAVAGCFDHVSPIEANHSTCSEPRGGARPEKRIGGRRGRGQRTDDSDAFPLCRKHHGQFTRFASRGEADGAFAGWTKKELDAWQRQQSARYWGAYQTWLSDRGVTVAEENDPKRRSLRVGGLDVDAEIEDIVRIHHGEQGEKANQLRLEIKGLCRRVAKAATGAVF